MAQILEGDAHTSAAVESGLRLWPQDVDAQLFLGHLLTPRGQTDRALTHFRTQLASSVPNAEQPAVLGMKAERLASGQFAGSIQPPNLTSSMIHTSLSIGIVPVNHAPLRVALADICLVLEASWRLQCDVLPPLAIPEAAILDPERQQYAAEVIVKQIERQMPFQSRRHSHVLAVTDHDTYGPDTSFVFSWEYANADHAVGVLSTSRFVSGIPDFYEPEIIPTRRVALQALSTTGRMLGFERPTDPPCPLAYPNSLEEFQQEGLRLCASEEQQRDELLQRKGGATAVFGAALAEKIDAVYRRYFIQ